MLLHSHDPSAVPGGLQTVSRPDLRLTLQKLAPCLRAQTSCLWIRVPLETQNSEGLVESSGLMEEMSHSLIWGIPHFGGVYYYHQPGGMGDWTHA